MDVFLYFNIRNMVSYDRCQRKTSGCVADICFSGIYQRTNILRSRMRSAEARICEPALSKEKQAAAQQTFVFQASISEQICCEAATNIYGRGIQGYGKRTIRQQIRIYPAECRLCDRLWKCVEISMDGWNKRRRSICLTVYSLSDCSWNAGDDDGVCNGTGSAGKSSENVS